MVDVAGVLVEMINDGKGGFVLVGLIVFFVDFIDFINIVTIYVFLNFVKPGNLENMFESFADSLQISPFPMFNFPFPFT